MKNNFNIGLVIKKSIVVVIGVILTTLGISLFYALNIGTDPISVLVDGEHTLFNLNYGTVTLINNTVLLIFGVLFARKYLHIGTVIGGLLAGPLINLFVPMFKSFIYESFNFWVKFTLLFPAVLLMGIGIALVIGVNFGVGTMDLLTLKIRDMSKKDLKWIKIILDIIFAVAGYLMGGVIGAGTIVGVLLTGPIIGYAIPYWKKVLKKLNIDDSEEKKAVFGAQLCES